MDRTEYTRAARQSARAVLIDDAARLVLIKRTKTGQRPYWTTPGGGVEPEDATIEDTLARELAEELSAEATVVSHLFTDRGARSDGKSAQHFFLARLTSLDEAARTGPEFTDPTRGAYDLDRVDLANPAALSGIDLRPAMIKDFILANHRDLIATALDDG